MTAAEDSRAPVPSGLPRVVVSSVVRSSHKGESHGGLYLVDLVSGEVEQVLDWDDPAIDWEGRGADRGLRGIAFHGGRVFLAASDEIFVYDRAFRPITSFRNPYLKHCHEIDIGGDTLYATSTGFDSVLAFDLGSWSFSTSFCLRQRARGLTRQTRIGLSAYDPMGSQGPAPGDTIHLNSVRHSDGAIYLAGTRLDHLYCIRGERLDAHAVIPEGSHNAQPHGDGVLLNHTASDRVCRLDRHGRTLSALPVPSWDPAAVRYSDLPRDVARVGFARGLAPIDHDLVVAGSSPATVTLYSLDPPAALRSITLTDDVRNAVHGLEPWPYD